MWTSQQTFKRSLWDSRRRSSPPCTRVSCHWHSCQYFQQVLFTCAYSEMGHVLISHCFSVLQRRPLTETAPGCQLAWISSQAKRVAVEKKKTVEWESSIYRGAIITPVYNIMLSHINVLFLAGIWWQNSPRARYGSWQSMTTVANILIKFCKNTIPSYPKQRPWVTHCMPLCKHKENPCFLLECSREKPNTWLDHIHRKNTVLHNTTTMSTYCREKLTELVITGCY